MAGHFKSHNRDTEQGYQPLLLVLMVVLVAVAPIIIFRDFTPSNELRYLSIADECLASGRWWAFTNHGIPYADKPPLYLWFVMLGKWLLGSHQMWFLCLFSIIPSFVIAGVMYRWTLSELDTDFRKCALLMLFTCGLFAGMVFTLRMDMLMSMFILLSLYQFRKLETSPEKPPVGQRFLFALWVFLAVFSKGPMGILIPLVATLVWALLTRRIRLWTRAWGWPTWTLLIVLCAGWFGMVYAEGGTGYLDNLLVHQTVGRAVNSFHHKRPFWYYLVSLTYTTQPWTFLIFGAVVYGLRKFPIRNYKAAEASLFNYFLVIVLSTFVLLSVISSKLQVYMLPAYPFMVWLAAMVCSMERRPPGLRLINLAIAVPAAILAIVGFAVPLVADCGWVPDLGVNIAGDRVLRWAWYALMCGGFLTLWNLYRLKRTATAIEALAMTVLILVFIAGLAIRSFNSDLGYRSISSEALSIKEEHPDAEIMTWRIDRPENIDAYLDGTPFRIVEGTDTVKEMPLSSYPAIVMTRQDREQEVPDVIESHRLGSKYIVLYCDTTITYH